MKNIFIEIIKRDLLLYMRSKGEWGSTLLFFIMIVSLFPLVLESNMLKPIAPAIIWIGALLATLLSLESLFRADKNIGVFEQFLLSPHSMPMLVAAKMIAHWLATGLPLLLVTPFIGIAFDLSIYELKILVETLLLGTPSLSMIGILGVALTINLARGGLLLAILVLPLYIPILILGASAVILAIEGYMIQGQLALLAAFTICSMVLTPIAVAGALRADSE